ncbi:hypothetical protein AB0L34_21845 [Micromonospora sp. NPDC052213]|uniref:hypothetical protein n=1 Tax=Micromonospora sp. NPDC052213 TaxID=3155812 RepID=UPI00342F3432
MPAPLSRRCAGYPALTWSLPWSRRRNPARSGVLVAHARQRLNGYLHIDPEDIAGVATQLRRCDLTRRRTVAVADGVGLVFCRGDVLWWPTGGRAYG